MTKLNNVQKELQTFMDYRFAHSHLIHQRNDSVKLKSHRNEIQEHFNNSKHWTKNTRGWSHKVYGLVVTFMPNNGYRLSTDY